MRVCFSSAYSDDKVYIVENGKAVKKSEVGNRKPCKLKYFRQKLFKFN
ncbi:MAG: hypothetical protein ACRC0V_10160 [Fusobacteriaceae bacterium]